MPTEIWVALISAIAIVSAAILPAFLIERARRELRHEIVIAARQRAEDKIQCDLDVAAKEKILKAKITETSKMAVPQ